MIQSAEKKRKNENQLYLEDRYDKEAITIDYWLYLANAKRIPAHGASEKDIAAAEALKEAYIAKARALYQEKVKKEEISREEFDARYAIHYFTEDWL